MNIQYSRLKVQRKIFFTMNRKTIILRTFTRFNCEVTIDGKVTELNSTFIMFVLCFLTSPHWTCLKQVLDKHLQANSTSWIKLGGRWNES